MEQFYCIKLIAKNGKRGYIVEGAQPNTFDFSENWTTRQVIKFETFTKANHFIKKNKLQNNQVKAYIRDHVDFKNDKPLPGPTILGQEKKN